MAATESKGELQTIDLSKLNIQQLAQLKNQVDNELMVFQDSVHSLKIAQTKFLESKESLDKITPESKGKDIMVPLTGSMYVPGKIADSEKVIIDIGTGYYIEKDVEAAKDYFKRKVAFVTEQMEKIQAIGVEKSKIKEVLMDVMESKIQIMGAQRPVAADT
ncbi:prefoldin subunit 5 [Macrosteles quadrilineatus]|uniref:prefoldin subunit 5 n=1 Tax=Macrosteles quadrilineatus TaxID=74068 RepID=UPI0023E32882|nr:prefoldin subunit 5 [Macrosteles quadrilineatus]